MGPLSDYEDNIKNALESNGDFDEKDAEMWEDQGPTEVLIKKLLRDKVFSDQEQADAAVYIAWGSKTGDPRDYAMKYLNWKRMTTDHYKTTIQTWFLRESDLNDIQRGIFDAWNDMGDENESSEHPVEIEVRANNKLFSDIPLNVLETASVRKLIPYIKKLAWMTEANDIATYINYGHNKGSIIWWITNDGIFKSKKASSDYETHNSLGVDERKVKFVGRYDPKKKIITAVDMDKYRKRIGNEEFPQDVLNLLKFEFGDENSVKIYEGKRKKKSSSIVDPVNFTYYS